MKFNTLKLITSTPLTQKKKLKALLRFFWWGIYSKIISKKKKYNFIGDTNITIIKGISTSELQYYCGFSEFKDMGFLIHFLRKEDTFVDVGANIGSYTLLASSHIGAETIAVEPVPITFSYLQENINQNKIGNKVNALNIGLSNEISTLKFSALLDAVNHVISDEEAMKMPFVEVPVDTLDNISKGKHPICIKIDVEGFETNVINGASSTLSNPSLQAIIIELNGSANQYGFDESLIHYKLLKYGFKPYDYNPLCRTFESLKSYGNFNTIYLRDIEFAKNRVINAPKQIVFGTTF
jgi:FkbM family methyltransferase